MKQVYFKKPNGKFVRVGIASTDETVKVKLDNGYELTMPELEGMQAEGAAYFAAKEATEEEVAPE